MDCAGFWVLKSKKKIRFGVSKLYDNLYDVYRDQCGGMSLYNVVDLISTNIVLQNVRMKISLADPKMSSYGYPPKLLISSTYCRRDDMSITINIFIIVTSRSNTSCGPPAVAIYLRVAFFF